MITGLAHLCFTTRDLDSAISFYCDKLGFRPAFDFVNAEGERFGAYLHIGGRAFLELFQRKDDNAPGGNYQHMCLEVDDIRSTVEQLRQDGVEVGEITLGSDNSWQAWLQDPDGNKIELHGYTPESKQTRYLDLG